MADRFEEELGRNPYVTLAQVKDYLSISSNTHDARIANIIFYATSIVEHYIGQEVVAKDYIEIFDGGVSSVFVNRLPLSNVYYVSEFDGVEHVLLADPSTIGTPRTLTNSTTTIEFKNNAHLTTKVKKFGRSSLKLEEADYLHMATVPNELQFEESDFTVEMFVRLDEPLQNTVVFEINTDNTNYMKLSLANGYGLAFESSVDGDVSIVSGANAFVEMRNYDKKRWNHIAVTKDSDNERLYLHFNGNTVANASYTVLEHTFTDNVNIGTTFKGYIDECRVSTKARYKTNFTTPSNRFRPDEDTVMLLHLDGKNGSTNTSDSHAATPEYSFARDTGEITRDVGSIGINGRYSRSTRSYPSLGLSGVTTFRPFPSGVKVSYRAGYETTNIPYDLQVATLDYIKLLYKQDQERQGFTFEGERGNNFNLSANFPPHIRRVLDMYRIID